MRVQTVFGRITESAHKQAFGTALVFLRITFGIGLLAIGRSAWKLGNMSGYSVPTAEPFAALLQALTQNGGMTAILGVAFMVVGVCFVLGVLTRPAAIAFGVLAVGLDIFFLPFPVVKALIPIQIGALSVALLALSGGAGNAMGLNGIIMRNISRPGSLARLLFG